MLPWPPPHITDLLQEAGRIALHYYQSPTRSIKYDGTVVTLADQEIEALFVKHLDHPQRHQYLLGEETILTRTNDYLANALAHDAYIVDPIDGTACYAHHVPIWGISIGYAHQGKLCGGAVYLPLQGELFISRGNQVYYGAGTPGQIPELHPLPPLPPADPQHGLIAVTQAIAKYGSIHLPNVVHNLACAVVPLTYLMLGRYYGYIAQIRLWDIAGSWPLLAMAGIQAIGSDGTPLPLQIDADTWHLDLKHPDCLKLKQHYIFGPPGAADYIVNQLNWPTKRY